MTAAFERYNLPPFFPLVVVLAPSVRMIFRLAQPEHLGSVYPGPCSAHRVNISCDAAPDQLTACFLASAACRAAARGSSGLLPAPTGAPAEDPRTVCPPLEVNKEPTVKVS
jgi:hypothetical protein